MRSSVNRYRVEYSYPSAFFREGQIWETTAHGGFIADFTRPPAKADWPEVAKEIETAEGICGVTITAVIPDNNC